MSQEKLEFLGRKLKKKSSPFGGIQLFVTGDFFQLPPVSKGNELKKFAFEAPVWSSCFQIQIELTEVFRQSDSSFVALLNEIRRGHCSLETVEELRKCSTCPLAENGIVLTKLYPHKVHCCLFTQNLWNIVGVPQYCLLDVVFQV